MAFKHTVTGAGLRWKQCGVRWVQVTMVGARSLRERARLSNSCGCGAGADKNLFNPRRTLLATSKGKQLF